jgi:hypothetical protein
MWYLSLGVLSIVGGLHEGLAARHIDCIGGGDKVNRVAAIFGTSLLAGLVATTSLALSQNLYRLSCSELWYERNNIFKDAGYCFKTSRAIRTFGNAGCAYDSESDVPLSERDRQRVNAIQRIEREKGCPR